MPLTVEEAKAIMQAATIDVWNAASQPARRALMEKYFSPSIKAYAPDGSETTGYDAVRRSANDVTLLPADLSEQCDAAYENLHAEDRSEWRFEPEGDLWVNGNAIMQYWFFGKGEQGWRGWDIIIVGEDGKVSSLYGLVHGMHNHGK